MNAGVVIDSWKLSIFKRRLSEAGYEFTEHPGITPNTTTLKVAYEWLHELQPIVTAANEECRAVKAARCMIDKKA